MEQERAVSYLVDSDLPNGLEQKNVIIQRDRYGYGLTVSGDNPVFVLSVREGGAAQRAGINVHDQIIKVNGTRVTHCTHVDVVNLIKSGPYAQLTLLGQPKLPIQKSVPNDSQNGRTQTRTQTLPERSNSILSTNSILPTFDTKKARDQYEKILKQLDIAKKELDRQRLKGLNHNPNRISQLENQVRQYEQQLAEIKRRLESLDSTSEPLPSKTDDNPVNRSHTFPESSTNRTGTIMTGIPLTSSSSSSSTTIVNSPLQQFKRKFQNPKTETYDLIKNCDSSNNLSTEETFKYRESTENEDDNIHSSSSNIQSITTFDELQQLINTSNWVPLTIFLNFLLTDNNSDPSHLLFYILIEELRIRKAENRSELLRWIFEIHSTFTMNPSPLYIGLPQSQIDAINHWLEMPQHELTDDIKNIFNDAKDYVKSIIIDRQISDFNNKRIYTLNQDGNTKPQHIIEENLRTIFEHHYKSTSIDDWNSIKHARSLALICALATYLKRCDMKKCGNIPLEKIPKFCDREQKRFMQKLQQRTTLMKKIKDHQLNEHQFLVQTLCQVCSKPLWGINYQGYLCGYCQQAYHRECVINSEKCSKDRTKLRKIVNHRNPSSPSRTGSINDGRESSVPIDIYESSPGGTEDPSDGNLSNAEQNKIATIGRCSSDRRAAPERPVAPKNRSSSESDNSDEGNPQMGGNTIDELLNHRSESDTLEHNTNSSETLTTDGDSDLEADVNTLPNLSEFIPNETLQILYKTREWKFQTTINELIHTERTHLKSLKIMKKCFRQPFESFPGMSPVELDCIFRNLDQLISLHTQFKYALRQHREDANDHVVRHIGDLILKYLDGDKGEEFAQACALFIEDQSQALKLIKKKEQSPEFAALMRNCEANPLCRRLTLKDYLPCVMTRFTKYKMLFEAMKKFVSDDVIESEKLTKCAECADNILKRMNMARLKKEQEALLKQIKSNLEIQIPNDEKLQNLLDCLELSNNRLLHSGILKLLPDLTTQKTEFECCLFTDMFVFFQKISLQPSEQRGIEESYKYVLKEHQRDATSGRHQRPRTAGTTNKYSAAQNFVLTPIIRLEHLLIKKKACGGARSFYVIDTDKKQLIEVEANSKDDLEKWLEWIEKARKPFEKSKTYPISSNENNSSSTISTIRTTITEEQANIQSTDKDTMESLYESILSTDKELKRLLHEKEMLLARLLNIPQDTSTSTVHSYKPNTSLEAITYATTYHNQIMQLVNQTNKTIDTQMISLLLLQLGEQLTLALKFLNQNSKSTEHDSESLGRTNTSVSATQSQIYSDLSISSLPSSESLTNPFQPESSVTDLDETVKSPPLHKDREIVEHFDVEVSDDGGQSSGADEEENHIGINEDSDDEDEIAHFDTLQQSNLNETYSTDTKRNQPIEEQAINLELCDEEVYDNLKSNDNNNNNGLSHISEA